MPRGTNQREERLHANARSLMSRGAAAAAGGSLGLTKEEALALARRLAEDHVSVPDYLEQTRIERDMVTSDAMKADGERKACLQDECTICLGNWLDGELVTSLPCQHCFHTSCLDEALTHSTRCPTCRAVIVPELMKKFKNKPENPDDSLRLSPMENMGDDDEGGPEPEPEPEPEPSGVVGQAWNYVRSLGARSKKKKKPRPTQKKKKPKPTQKKKKPRPTQKKKKPKPTQKKPRRTRLN
jgi:hypothetical protein